jgi:hypothetical protein
VCCLHTYRRDNILELALHGLACAMSLLSLRCFFLIAVLKMEQQIPCGMLANVIFLQVSQLDMLGLEL